MVGVGCCCAASTDRFTGTFIPLIIVLDGRKIAVFTWRRALPLLQYGATIIAQFAGQITVSLLA